MDAFFEHHRTIERRPTAPSPLHPGAAVRTDSLVEQRGFEPPVLFGLFPGKADEVRSRIS